VAEGRLRISPTPAGRDKSSVRPVGRPSTKNQVANMKHYVAFPLADRSDTVVAEVVELTDETGHEPAAFPEGVVNKAGEAFEQALAKVKPIAKAVIAAVSGIAEGISEANVEFGLKLNGRVGIILASGSVETNFKVSLKWKRG
jgi:hypothetical protein